MSGLGVSGLVAAYVFIAMLLLSINLYSNWSWPVKAGTVILGTIFYSVTYVSIPELLGWPSADDLPGKFRLVAIHVQQPDKVTEDEGAIFLWVTDANQLAANPEPRAYRLPYSGPMHELAVSAAAKLGKDVPLLGEYREPDDDARVLDEDARTSQTSTPVKFYEVPDPLFPEK